MNGEVEALIDNSVMPREDAEKVVLLFMYHRRPQGSTLEQIKLVLAWAEETFLQQTFLQNVLDATMAPALDENGEVAFLLTDKGMRIAEQMAEVITSDADADGVRKAKS